MFCKVRKLCRTSPVYVTALLLMINLSNARLNVSLNFHSCVYSGSGFDIDSDYYIALIDQNGHSTDTHWNIRGHGGDDNSVTTMRWFPITATLNLSSADDLLGITIYTDYWNNIDALCIDLSKSPINITLLNTVTNVTTSRQLTHIVTEDGYKSNSDIVWITEGNQVCDEGDVCQSKATFTGLPQKMRVYSVDFRICVYTIDTNADTYGPLYVNITGHGSMYSDPDSSTGQLWLNGNEDLWAGEYRTLAVVTLDMGAIRYVTIGNDASNGVCFQKIQMKAIGIDAEYVPYCEYIANMLASNGTYFWIDDPCDEPYACSPYVTIPTQNDTMSATIVYRSCSISTSEFAIQLLGVDVAAHAVTISPTHQLLSWHNVSVEGMFPIDNITQAMVIMVDNERSGHHWCMDGLTVHYGNNQSVSFQFSQHKWLNNTDDIVILEPGQMFNSPPTEQHWSVWEWIHHQNHLFYVEMALLPFMCLTPCLVTCLACYVHKSFKGADYPRWTAVFKFFSELGDFWSDVLFVALLFLRKHSLMWWALLFVTLPYVISCAVMIYFIATLRKNDASRMYIDRYDTLIVFLSVFSTFYPTTQLLMSKLCHLSILSLYMRRYHYLRMGVFRFVNVVLLEDIPQLVIQVLYLTDDSFDLIAWIACGFSAMSLLTAILANSSRFAFYLFTVRGRELHEHLQTGMLNIVLKFKASNIRSFHCNSQYLVASALRKLIGCEKDEIEVFAIREEGGDTLSMRICIFDFDNKSDTVDMLRMSRVVNDLDASKARQLRVSERLLNATIEGSDINRRFCQLLQTNLQLSNAPFDIEIAFGNRTDIDLNVMQSRSISPVTASEQF